MKKISILFTSLLFLYSCGEGVVEVTNTSFEPRITVEGMLAPNHPVKVHLSKNFRLDNSATIQDIALDASKTVAQIVDVESGNSYTLLPNFPVNPSSPFDFFYEYKGSDLIIQQGKKYRLEVETEIEGEKIWTKSTTEVPLKGLKILRQNADSLKFIQKDAQGEIINLELTILRSENSDFYLHTITPLTADSSTYIYNHVTGKRDSSDYDEEESDETRFRFGWIQNTPLTVGESSFPVVWFNLYYYSTYRVVVMATDKNYREFLQTARRVQEPDGNFHEAKFNFEGDGVGYFGSFVSDTTYFTVLR